MRALTAVLAAWIVLAGCGGSSPSGSVAGGSHPRHRAPAKPAPQRHRVQVKAVLDSTPQPGWHRYTGPVPILVYHELGTAPAGALFPALYVSDSDFTAEMAWLQAHGYTAVTLDELMQAWYRGGTLPSKPIVITFDNGYPPQVYFAPRVMARYGWPGVLNEITENHLHPGMIRHVLRLGWEVDSHSLTHPDLTTLDASELKAQVADSRTFLQRTFKIPVNSFCYPSSRYDAAVVAAVKAAGYEDAVTENPGYATRADPYLLDRFEIEGGVSELAADLAEPH